jgi:plastocyanin
LATAGALPAVAVSETTPAIEAMNGPGTYGEPHSWKPAAATVTEGGAVTISNTTGTPHGLEWLSPPATPSCTGNIPIGSFASSWSGTCTFSKAGTYNFRCTIHAEMTGTITVNPNGTTTTTTTTPISTTPAPGGGGSGSPPSTANPGSGSTPVSGTSGSPAAASGLTAVSLASRQHGNSVHGSLVVSPAGAGGRLEVALLARGASLAKVGRPPQVRVGRLVRSSLRPGKVSFTVPLSAKAKRALRLHRRLALTVAIVLTPAQGSAATVTRSVVVTR